MSKNRTSFLWLDWLLLTAIGGLLVVLFWPAIEAWRNRPQAGIQVGQQFIHEGKDDNDPAAFCLNYLVYLPKEYGTDSSHKWPLVVFLHGAGERGQDLKVVQRFGLPRQASEGEQLPFILTSPQCPTELHWTPEQVVKLVENVSNRFSVDRDRVYLTGYSMGGFGTWATACYDPNRFAAIAPLSGGGEPSQAKRLVNLPIWAFHGEKDEVVSLDASKQMVDAVRKCGGHVNFTVYPGLGHWICDLPYHDKQFYEWLLAQRRERKSTTGEKDGGK